MGTSRSAILREKGALRSTDPVLIQHFIYIREKYFLSNRELFRFTSIESSLEFVEGILFRSNSTS